MYWNIPDDAFVVVCPNGGIRSFQNLNMMMSDYLGFANIGNLHHYYESIGIAATTSNGGTLVAHLQGVNAQTDYFEDFFILSNMNPSGIATLRERIEELWCFTSQE